MSDLSREAAERVSALVDGRLHGDALLLALDDLAHSTRARADWDDYHLIGRAMRSPTQDVQVCDLSFVARLNQRLEQEKVKIEPLPPAPVVVIDPLPQAANQPAWRRVAGLASVALVAMLAWQGLDQFSGSSPVGQTLALQGTRADASPGMVAAPMGADSAGQVMIRTDGTSALTASSDAPVMIRDSHLDALLATHRNFAGASALQLAPGFVRNANYEEFGR